MNYTGAILPVLASSIILIFYFIRFASGPLQNFAFLPAFFGPNFSNPIRKFQKKISAVYFPDAASAEKAAGLSSKIPHLLFFLACLQTILFFYQIFTVDTSSVSAVLFASEDMALWQLTASALVNPAGILLLVFLIFSFTASLLAVYYRKKGIPGENYPLSISGIQFAFILLMVFVPDLQAFRIYDQEMKLGGGLARTHLEFPEFLSLLFYVSAIPLFLFRFALSAVREKRSREIAILFERILLAAAALLFSISFFMDVYSRNFYPGEYFSFFGKKSYVISFLLFLTIPYLFIFEKSEDTGSRRMVPADAAVFFLSLFSLLELMISESAVLILALPASLSLLYLSIQSARKSSDSMPASRWIGAGWNFTLTGFFILYPVFKAAGLCMSENISFCSPENPSVFSFFIYLFSLLSMFFLWKTLESAGGISSGAKRIAIAAVLAAALAAVPVIFLSRELDFLNPQNIAVYFLFPCFAFFLMFYFLTVLYENQKKHRDSDKMTQGFVYLFREFAGNHALYVPAFFVCSAGFILASSSAFLSGDGEKYTFQYYLFPPESEYSSYVHYKSDDKFYYSGYEVSSGDVFILPLYNDNADPKKKEHLALMREIHTSVHVPTHYRIKSVDANVRPELDGSGEDSDYFDAFSNILPEGKIVSSEKFYPVLNPVSGEYHKINSGENSRKNIRIPGMLTGIVDGLIVNPGEIEIPGAASINHLFEYYYVYSNHSADFYSGVFPRKISLSLQVKKAPWFILYYSAAMLFLLCIPVLAMKIFQLIRKQ